MRRPPLRLLLLGPVSLILLFGSIALGFYVQRSVSGDLIANVDDELVRALNAGRGAPARTAPGFPADRELPAGDGVAGAQVPLEVLIDGAGDVEVISTIDASFDLAALDSLDLNAGNQTIDGAPRYRLAVVQEPSGRTRVVGLSLESVDDSLDSLRRSLIIGGLVLLAAQVVGVWFIAGSVARPVSQMSALAHDIAGGDLDAMVGPPQGSRETADLAVDLQQMLEQLKTTIAEQQQSAASANRAREDMERFMADASHELRTPLTALKGYSDLYRGNMLDAEGLDRAMDRIGSESDRLTDLVVGLLDLVRQESHASGTVDVTATVQQVADDVTAAYPGRSISFAAADAAQPVLVCGDENRLHQAVLNLAANACQHTEADSPIELSLDVDDTQVQIAVVDHGKGVDLAEADRLFVAFARGDESRSRHSHDGAGLGLALVRRIANQHGGTAWIRETAGGGATFGITLERAPAD